MGLLVEVLIATRKEEYITDRVGKICDAKLMI
jgi:hypothetical protein